MKKYEETGIKQPYPRKLILYFKMADMLTFSFILDGGIFFLFFTFLECGCGVWDVDDLFTQVQNIPKKIIQISTTGRR